MKTYYYREKCREIKKKKTGKGKLCTKGKKQASKKLSEVAKTKLLRVGCGALVLHCSHVVLWKKWDFQDFGVGKYCFVAGGGNGLAGDPVNLVEGMGPQQAVVCSPNEQLQRERLAF